MKMDNRLGQTKVMKSGQKATIVQYNNSTDIDVMLEEGVVVCGKSYKEFKEGTIKVKPQDKVYMVSSYVPPQRDYLGKMNMFI